MMLAPHSMGRQRAGVGKVLSTTSGRPASCAASAKVWMSRTVSAGLATVSPKTSLVLGRMAAAISSLLARGLTKVDSMPSLGRVTEKRLMVPP